MKGVAFLGDRRVGFLDVPDPVPGHGEVVIAVKASGLCGSDLHPYRAAHDAGLAHGQRFIGGHEPCGIIEDVGPGVPEHVARRGDRVMVHHYHGCAICSHCRSGWPQLCRPETRTVYTVNAHGSHAPYMKVPATTLVRLDEALSFDAGAAIACGTGTAWGALERLRPTGKETLAVFGQGPVGLSATLLASARGHRVIAIDLDESRLAMAKEFGAHDTLNAGTHDPVEALRDFTAGKGVDMVIETSGSPRAAAAGLAATAIWGKVCLVGIGASLSIDLRAYLDRQVTVMTSYSMSLTGQEACAEFIVERGLDVDRLFTDRWRLDQAQEAYRVFDAQSGGKAVFVF